MIISMAGGSLLGLHDSKPILAIRCREREPSTSSAFPTSIDRFRLEMRFNAANLNDRFCSRLCENASEVSCAREGFWEQHCQLLSFCANPSGPDRCDQGLDAHDLDHSLHIVC